MAVLQLIKSKLFRFKNKFGKSNGSALVEKTLVIAVVITTALASIDAFLLHKAKGYNCDATDAATRILQVHYNQVDPANYTEWSLIRDKTTAALAKVGYYPNTSSPSADPAGKIAYSFEREDETSNEINVQDRVPFTYLTPFPGQSKAKIFSRNCTDSNNCSWSEFATLEHPAVSDTSASTLPIVVIAEKYKSLSGLFDKELLSCLNYDNLFVPSPDPNADPTPDPETTPDPVPPSDIPFATPTPEATETPGGACKIENNDADGGSDITEITACENQNEGGNCHSFNDKSCACGCCPEEQKKCEENEGDPQPYNPESADGSESCACQCGGDIGAGGASTPNRKEMRETCESQTGEWIFNSKPSPECGECICNPDAKQECEDEGGNWSDKNCTCSECVTGSKKEIECKAQGCAWLSLTCECRCGPGNSVWDSERNMFVDPNTGLAVADIDLNPVNGDFDGPIGTEWDPERNIYIDPSTGEPLYDSFGEPLPGTPGFNAPPNTTWDPSRQMYVDKNTGEPRFGPDRTPIGPEGN